MNELRVKIHYWCWNNVQLKFAHYCLKPTNPNRRRNLATFSKGEREKEFQQIKVFLNQNSQTVFEVSLDGFMQEGTKAEDQDTECTQLSPEGTEKPAVICLEVTNGCIRESSANWSLADKLIHIHNLCDKSFHDYPLVNSVVCPQHWSTSWDQMDSYRWMIPQESIIFQGLQKKHRHLAPNSVEVFMVHSVHTGARMECYVINTPPMQMELESLKIVASAVTEVLTSQSQLTHTVSF